MIQDIVSEQNVVADIEVITVRTLEDAIKYRHIVGPTIQVDGLDIEPEARAIIQFGIM